MTRSDHRKRPVPSGIRSCGWACERRHLVSLETLADPCLMCSGWLVLDCLGHRPFHPTVGRIDRGGRFSRWATFTPVAGIWQLAS
ncbi:hypothetical protein ASE04_17455 [Rhizobium sp. Root708]|nr:hypothetical protein ASE04_17455 [Rhizobium sp. Root708]